MHEMQFISRNGCNNSINFHRMCHCTVWVTTILIKPYAEVRHPI